MFLTKYENYYYFRTHHQVVFLKKLLHGLSRNVQMDLVTNYGD